MKFEATMTGQGFRPMSSTMAGSFDLARCRPWFLREGTSCVRSRTSESCVAIRSVLVFTISESDNK
eukprot:scaffold6632_cov102-Cylindrotheca_fusiformis.AAC.5